MTISSTTRKAGPFTGNGVTVAFPFTFKVFTTADVLVVQAVTATGVETTLALGTHYTVALNADQNTSPGGTITALVAPPTGSTLTATSQVANTQSTDLTNLGGFYPTVINTALDRATILIQQLAEKLGRTLQFSVSDTPSTGLPSLASRMGKFLAFDAGGHPVASSGTGADAGLRTDLAAPTGASLVGYAGGTTAAAALDIVVKNALHGKKLSDVLSKAHSGQAITIACEGTSITYGQDTSGTGTGLPINGASQSRSTQPYPENLQEALGLMGFAGGVTVTNRGFPGDTTIEGLTRWEASAATDVVILEYGHNDANNYGGYGHGPVPLATYRANLELLILRRLAQGAAVIVLGSTNVQDTAANETIRPYTLAARQLAAQFGCLFVDMAEELQSLTAQWTDGVHLTSFAYAEMGWQLAALFVKRNGDMQRVGPGDIFYPDDQLGHVTAGRVIDFAGAKGNARLIYLNAGESHAIGVDCLADLMPVIHSFSSAAGARIIGAYYAGGGGADRGVTAPVYEHNSSAGIRQSFLGPKLRKGKRLFVLRNDGAVPVYIESVEFVGSGHLYSTHGILKKSLALSGSFQSRYLSAAQPNWWCAADCFHKLVAPYSVGACLSLSDTVANGLAIWKDLPYSSSDLLGANGLFVWRDATALVIRDYVNGVASDTTIAAVFGAGDVVAEIHLEVTAAAVSAYVNGALVGTKATPANVSGYPGLIADKTAALVCHGLYFGGDVKGPY
jgi:lysophospholipase L1-like esterase